MNIIKQGEDFWVICKYFRKPEGGVPEQIIDLDPFEFYLSISFRNLERVRIKGIKNTSGIISFNVNPLLTANLASGVYNYEISALTLVGYNLTKLDNQLEILNSPLGQALASKSNARLIEPIVPPTTGIDYQTLEQFMIQITSSGTSAICQESWDSVDSLLVYMGNTLRGLPGLKGDDGLSAYEVAVKNGFEGSEIEWLESIKGPAGLNGLADYSKASNKPQINGVTLEGNKSSSELKIPTLDQVKKLEDSKLDANKQKTKVSQLENDSKYVKVDTKDLVNYLTSDEAASKSDLDKKQNTLVAGANITINPDTNTISASSGGGGGGEGGTTDHNQLTNRDAADQHPISAIAGLPQSLSSISETATIAKQSADTANTNVSSLSTAVSNLQTSKQNKLKAGTNITIDEDSNTISATGSGGGTGTDNHNSLTIESRSLNDQHPISAITDLATNLSTINTKAENAATAAESAGTKADSADTKATQAVKDSTQALLAASDATTIALRGWVNQGFIIMSTDGMTTTTIQQMLTDKAEATFGLVDNSMLVDSDYKVWVFSEDTGNWTYQGNYGSIGSGSGGASDEYQIFKTPENAKAQYLLKFIKALTIKKSSGRWFIEYVNATATAITFRLGILNDLSEVTTYQKSYNVVRSSSLVAYTSHFEDDDISIYFSNNINDYPPSIIQGDYNELALTDSCILKKNNLYLECELNQLKQIPMSEAFNEYIQGGTVIKGGLYMTSHYIVATSGSTYVIKGGLNHAYNVLSFYNKDLTYISGITATTSAERSISLPTGTAYLRITSPISGFQVRAFTNSYNCLELRVVDPSDDEATFELAISDIIYVPSNPYGITAYSFFPYYAIANKADLNFFKMSSVPEGSTYDEVTGKLSLSSASSSMVGTIVNNSKSIRDVAFKLVNVESATGTLSLNIVAVGDGGMGSNISYGLEENTNYTVIGNENYYAWTYQDLINPTYATTLKNNSLNRLMSGGVINFTNYMNTYGTRNETMDILILDMETFNMYYQSAVAVGLSPIVDEEYVIRTLDAILQIINKALEHNPDCKIIICPAHNPSGKESNPNIPEEVASQQLQRLNISIIKTFNIFDYVKIVNTNIICDKSLMGDTTELNSNAAAYIKNIKCAIKDFQ